LIESRCSGRGKPPASVIDVVVNGCLREIRYKAKATFGIALNPFTIQDSLGGVVAGVEGFWRELR